MQRRKSAFTLIELLVVIAIIAILAAILFPVFAQARESAQQAANLSNTKQMGTALNIYLADHDDMMPLTQPVNHRMTRTHGMVAWGLSPNPVTAGEYGNEYGWLAQIHPYMKNLGIMQNQNARHEFAVWQAAAGHKARSLKANLTMNGYLQSLSSSAIEAPSAVPAFWQGLGVVNYIDGAYAFAPILQPTTNRSPSFTAPLYTFTRSGADCTVGWMGNWGQWHRTYFAHREGFVYSRTDSSAKYTRAVGAKETSPFSRLTSTPGRWAGTLEGSAEVGEGSTPFFHQHPVDGPAGCTYSYFFSPYREQ